MSAYQVSTTNRRIILLAVLSLIASLLTVNFNAPPASATLENFTFAGATDTVAEGGGSIDVPVELTANEANLLQATSIDVELDPSSTATSGTDFTFTSPTTVSWALGEAPSTKNVSIAITDDLWDDEGETIVLNLVTPVPVTATTGVSTITITITDDDAVATIDIDDLTVNENAGTASFVVNRVGTTEGVVSFDYDTTDGTATSPSDFASVAGGSGSLPAGTDGSTTVAVTIVDDLWDDEGETFTVDLSNESSNVTISDATATGTITDNDPVATIDIDDLTFDEDVGTASFVVNRVGTTEGVVNFDYDTTNGTATAPGDFTAVSGGSGTIPAGTDGGTTVDVTIVDDGFDDDGESFTVTISGETSNVTISDATATGNITDNDGQPTISIADLSFDEDVGTASFTVSRSGSTVGAVTFVYNTGDGTAEAGTDYTAVVDGAGVIGAGTNGGTTVTVPITDDPRDENDQTFTVTISGVSANAGIGVATATGTIQDNDLPPVLTLSSPTASEAAGSLTFVASISAVSELEVSAAATSANVTTEVADFTALAGSPVTIAAGSTTTDVIVSVLDEAIFETNETFTVTLGSPVNATGTPVGTGTITNDDAAPVITIDDQNIAENAGPMTFTVTRTGLTEVAVAGTAATADGTATAPSDYTAIASQAVNIAPGGATGTALINVTLNDNATDETLNETFSLNVTGITGGTPATIAGTGTIIDDDGEPALSIDDVTVSEGGTASFTISLVGDTALDVSVRATTSDDTAVEPGDYDSKTQVRTITAGNTTATFTVDINNDVIDEDDEDFEVVLSDALNAVVADDTGVGTITDTDTPPVLTIADASLAEDGGSMVFTITRTGATERVVTVNATTFDDVAVAGSDFDATTESITVPSSGSSNTATFSVPITDDPLVETSETFEVDITTPTNATISGGVATAVGTITDNDIAGATISESDGNTSVIEGGLTDSYTVVLSSQPQADVTVNIDPGTQVNVNPTSLVFSNSTWDVAQTVTVTAIEDGTDEPDPHSGTIAHTATSAHGPFDDLDIDDLDVIVGDADSLLVTIDGPTVGAPGVVSTFTAQVNAGGTGTITYEWTAFLNGNPVATGDEATFEFTPSDGGIHVIQAIVGDSQGQNPAVFIQFRSLGDAQGSIFAGDIVWLAERGITKGCNPPANTEFCPDDFVTREQMAAFLVRFLGLTDNGGGNDFLDDNASIFQEEIARLAAAGITRGCNPPANTNFCPTGRVTREQMAAFLVRALGLTDNGGGNDFLDDNASIFQEEIARLAAAGITKGCNPPANTNFCPTDFVTRGQMAAFLRRADRILNP